MPPKPKKLSRVTHTRRTVLEWMGSGAAVFALPPALGACFPASKGQGDSCCAEGETGDSEPNTHDPGRSPDCPEGGFDFGPPDQEAKIYEDWNVRTVDPQDLDAILAGWALSVDGMVDEPLTLSFAQLLELARQDQVTDFHCVEGWSVYDVPWNGVHLSTLLELAGAKSSATHVTFHTIDGIYNESLPLDVALEEKTLLAYGVCGTTLPLDHGFPVRLVVPRLLAYKNPKYIERIELTDEPIEGFWVQRGYGYEGEVPEERLREGKY